MIFRGLGLILYTRLETDYKKPNPTEFYANSLQPFNPTKFYANSLQPLLLESLLSTLCRA